MKIVVIEGSPEELNRYLGLNAQNPACKDCSAEKTNSSVTNKQNVLNDQIIQTLGRVASLVKAKDEI